MWLSVQHLQIKLECVVYSRIVTQMGFVWGQVGGGGFPQTNNWADKLTDATHCALCFAATRSIDSLWRSIFFFVHL